MYNYIKKVKLICAVFFLALNAYGQLNGYYSYPLSSGLDNTVSCQAIFNNELYVGGSFTTAGGVAGVAYTKEVLQMLQGTEMRRLWAWKLMQRMARRT